MNKIVKGTQRKMVIVRTADSDLFDEVYFMLRKDVKRGAGASEESMLEEASRIINKSVFSREREVYGRGSISVRSFLFYLGGLFCGSGMVGLFWFIFSL